MPGAQPVSNPTSNPPSKGEKFEVEELEADAAERYVDAEEWIVWIVAGGGRLVVHELRAGVDLRENEFLERQFEELNVGYLEVVEVFESLRQARSTP